MSSKKILIADDSPTILALLKSILEGNDYQVIEAIDGVDAIEKAYKEDPELILLDILMPKMNGYQVCRLLKDDKLTSSIPIIILSSKDKKIDKYWGITAGADGYLTKDFNTPELIEAIEAALKISKKKSAPAVRQKRCSSNSIDILNRLNELLDKKLFQSTIINQINSIGRSLNNYEETITSILKLLDNVVDYDLAIIYTEDDRGKNCYAFQNKPVSRNVVKNMIERTLISVNIDPNKIMTQEAFHLKEIGCRKEGTVSYNDQKIKSFFSIPLCVHGMSQGILAISGIEDIVKKKEADELIVEYLEDTFFTEQTKETITYFASHASVIIDNAKLYNHNITLYKQLEKELRRAHDIQMSMLPQGNPIMKTLDIDAISFPAKEVGGDYYDYFGDLISYLGIVIGDVAGKGMPAALIMSMIKSAMQIQTNSCKSISEILFALNNFLCCQSLLVLMTFFGVIFDLKNDLIYYSNAGHHYPFIYRKRGEKIEMLEYSEYPLGTKANINYENKQTKIYRGDILILYTDGIIELLNDQTEQFGFDRFKELIKRNSDLSARELKQKIMDELVSYLGNTEQHDDITLVVIKRI
ncbi:MAG: SpoIIE family protein phosphatase [bacterium]